MYSQYCIFSIYIGCIACNTSTGIEVYGACFHIERGGIVDKRSILFALHADSIRSNGGMRLIPECVRSVYPGYGYAFSRKIEAGLSQHAHPVISVHLQDVFCADDYAAPLGYFLVSGVQKNALAGKRLITGGTEADISAP